MLPCIFLSERLSFDFNRTKKKKKNTHVPSHKDMAVYVHAILHLSTKADMGCIKYHSHTVCSHRCKLHVLYHRNTFSGMKLEMHAFLGAHPDKTRCMFICICLIKLILVYWTELQSYQPLGKRQFSIVKIYPWEKQTTEFHSLDMTAAVL